MDEQRFLTFYRQTASCLRAYVVAVTGNQTTADDIVQETFLRLLRSPPATDDCGALRGFVFRVASNLMTDEWRRRERERREAHGDIADHTVPPADVALRIDMARTFSRLSPQQRQLLWLAYVEGADHREIAAALQLQPLSVRVLLHRARRKLAEMIER